MKINAITSFRNNIGHNLNKNVSYTTQQPSFEGIFDIFKKQPVEKTPAQQESDDINEIVKGAIKGEKALVGCGAAFLAQLNELLRMGKEKNYRGYFNYVDTKTEKKNVTYGDIDKDLGIPSKINIWQNGKLKTVYEVFSTVPQSTFHVTDYKEDSETQYNFIGKRTLGFFYIDKDGLIIKQFPSNEGFYQQQARKVNNKEALLHYELYWDYKHPEKCHFLQNTETDAIMYGYDKKNKFWYVESVIPDNEKDNMTVFED